MERLSTIVGKEKCLEGQECSVWLFSCRSCYQLLLWEKGDTNSRIKPEMVFFQSLTNPVLLIIKSISALAYKSLFGILIIFSKAFNCYK